ncbi:MAG: hypothetical protein K2N47_00075 [Clostridia bacterium]|nr:hypothetical protein [Clostridia bacterium]
MSYTVDEKKKYHGHGFPKGEFSQGYLIGVTIYRGYGKGGASVHKEKRQKLIDDTKRKAQKGDQYSKGVMCAIRDCANERKAQNK